MHSGHDRGNWGRALLRNFDGLKDLLVPSVQKKLTGRPWSPSLHLQISMTIL